MLSNVVKNDIVKKTDNNTKIKNIEDEIPDITKLANNTSLNAKINEVKREVLSINNLATTSLTVVENKIYLFLTINSKTFEYNTQFSEKKITTDYDYCKYITTQELKS